VGGVAALALLGDHGLQALPRALTLVGVYAAYFLGWLGVALAVSAVAPSSRLALTVLLSLWVFNGFLAPRAASAVAQALVPAPSAPELQRAIDADLEQLTPWNTLVKQTTTALLAQYRVSRPEDLPVNPEGVALSRGEDADTAVYERHYGRLDDIYLRQARAMQWAGLVAPLLAVQAASTSLAGTDYAHHHDFLRAAERYRTAYVRTLNDTIVNQRDQKATWQFTQGRDLWDDVPPFAYTMPDAGWAVRQSGVSLVIVLGWTTLMLAAAVWAGSRLRVQ
jgi:ABC-2 type transport system permease protein